MTLCVDPKIIVAIDGYSSSGKSTMAKRLAHAVGYRYVDSGAMYRAVTLYAMEHGMIGPDGQPDVDRLSAALPDIHIDFKVTPDGQRTMLNGVDVEERIRSLEVSNNVSPVSAIKAVRRALTDAQQAYGLDGGIVMDGRDIGTAVFPDAALKVFVNASAETRARRRFEELKAKGLNPEYDEVLANVRERDHIDSTRKESPLRCADDAVRLDNSEMTLQQQDDFLLALFKERIAELSAK